MKSIRVRNLRSIIDSGEIEINRLNIFLGENSSGKSSILRLFPLLKETVNKELRGPLLWYGDTYDFGGFSESISRQANSPIINIEFSWDALSNKKQSRCADCRYYDRKPLGFLQSNEYKLTIAIGEKNGTPYFDTVTVVTDKHEIKLCTNSKNYLDIYIDNEKMSNDPLIWRYGVRGLLPDIVPYNSKRDTPIQMIRSEINKMIPNSYDGKLLNSDFESLFYIQSIRIEDIFAHITNEKNPFGKLIKQSLSYGSPEANKFCKNIILSNVFRCLEYADSYVSTTFESTYYMRPIRYSIGRYLRNKDLAVDGIDSSGENVTEFINSLDRKELTSLNKFLLSSLKIKVSVKKNGIASNQLLIETNDENKKVKYNIVDVGYGITQVLPIAILLWDKARKSNDCEFSDIIVIEQPEVHLHPRMQEFLAQLFISALMLSRENKGELRLVIETHSSVLINKIGRYIRDNNASDSKLSFNEKDVSIYLFEKKSGVTEIQKTNYDTSGRIQKWPIGFLD